jgi:hypothetical protein
LYGTVETRQSDIAILTGVGTLRFSIVEAFITTVSVTSDILVLFSEKHEVRMRGQLGQSISVGMPVTITKSYLLQFGEVE